MLLHAISQGCVCWIESTGIARVIEDSITRGWVSGIRRSVDFVLTTQEPTRRVAFGEFEGKRQRCEEARRERLQDIERLLR